MEWNLCKSPLAEVLERYNVLIIKCGIFEQIEFAEDSE